MKAKETKWFFYLTNTEATLKLRWGELDVPYDVPYRMWGKYQNLKLKGDVVKAECEGCWRR